MEECQPVQLEPFVHQVGGTSFMFKYDTSTVCKPLISREHHYYQVMPKSLSEFTPQYRGVVDVLVQEDSDGYITLIGYPDGMSPKHKKSLAHASGVNTRDSCGNSDSDGEELADHCVIKRKPEMRDGNGKRPAFMQSLSIDDSLELDTDNKEKNVNYSQNPWSIRCHKRHLEKLRQGNVASGTQKFILLENVVSHVNFPCILDLKMGTRQHGDDDQDSKRERKIQRCAATTSSSLGVRVCGMQVYQLNSENYVCKNKYYGRTLTVQGFKESLTMYLSNGYKLRVDVIDLIVEKLKQLHSILFKQNTFRFYSSSLLIMYDGRDRHVDVKKSSNNNGKEATVSKRKSCEDADGHCRSRSADRKTDTSAQSSPDRSRSRDHQRDSKDGDLSDGPIVDVKMIDFAHTTYQGHPADEVRHTGPDMGYLFGLENLIKMFLEIKSSCS